jgi:hypothetical protein
VRGLTALCTRRFLLEATATNEVLMAAAEMKRLAGQINVVIHSLGILLCLPHILEVGEQVEKVSLGAGNTGREFDLETNYRVAEFKFVHWRGGPEAAARVISPPRLGTRHLFDHATETDDAAAMQNRWIGAGLSTTAVSTVTAGFLLFRVWSCHREHTGAVSSPLSIIKVPLNR